MDFNKFFQSKLFKGILLGIGILVVLLIVLRLGISIGFWKANFSCRWGENYRQNFGGPKDRFMGGIEGREFMDAHGVFGQIIKIDASTIVIKGQDNIEKIVLIKDDTAIMSLREKIKISNLKVDDRVVIVGQPNNDGQIEAKLIRVLPAPDNMMPMQFPTPSNNI